MQAGLFFIRSQDGKSMLPREFEYVAEEDASVPGCLLFSKNIHVKVLHREQAASLQCGFRVIRNHLHPPHVDRDVLVYDGPRRPARKGADDLISHEVVRVFPLRFPSVLARSCRTHALKFIARLLGDGVVVFVVSRGRFVHVDIALLPNVDAGRRCDQVRLILVGPALCLLPLEGLSPLQSLDPLQAPNVVWCHDARHQHTSRRERRYERRRQVEDIVRGLEHLKREPVSRFPEQRSVRAFVRDFQGSDTERIGEVGDVRHEVDEKLRLVVVSAAVSRPNKQNASAHLLARC
mmetsp:Transcript_26684/g.67229  ORF Transcript_26684/g.67229 Transcript_26684/m.67229 type:complete len:292 (-) Transcript_26684:3314-4189(-)